MSTAAEKAKELVDKYKDMHSRAGGIGINEKQAKACAIICVDEILEGMPFRISDDVRNYYKKVKTELQKL